MSASARPILPPEVIASLTSSVVQASANARLAMSVSTALARLGFRPDLVADVVRTSAQVLKSSQAVMETMAEAQRAMESLGLPTLSPTPRAPVELPDGSFLDAVTYDRVMVALLVLLALLSVIEGRHGL